MKLLRPKEVYEQYRITRYTLEAYEKAGLIKPWFTPGGHRRWAEDDVVNLFHRPQTVVPINHNPNATRFTVEDVYKLMDSIDPNAELPTVSYEVFKLMESVERQTRPPKE